MDTAYLIMYWPPEGPAALRSIHRTEEGRDTILKSLKSDELEDEIYQFFGIETEVFD